MFGLYLEGFCLVWSQLTWLTFTVTTAPIISAITNKVTWSLPVDHVLLSSWSSWIPTEIVFPVPQGGALLDQDGFLVPALAWLWYFCVLPTAAGWLVRRRRSSCNSGSTSTSASSRTCPIDMVGCARVWVCLGGGIGMRGGRALLTSSAVARS